MTVNRNLHALLSRRSDGYWEFLATAAGVPASVEKTERLISRLALDSPTQNSVFPDLVDHRIQALAALDPKRIAKAAEQWALPNSTLVQDQYSPAADVHIAAWTAALRFLPGQVQERVLSGDVPHALRGEKIALVDPVPSFQDWNEFITFVELSEGYANFRSLDRSQVSSAAPVKSRDLERLLAIPHGVRKQGSWTERWGRFDVLRVLRKYVRRLDSHATKYLEDLTRDTCLAHEDDHTGKLLLMELAREVDSKNPILEEVKDSLIRVLSATENPAQYLKTAYTIMNGGWRLP